MAERDEIEELRRENEELKKELERVKEHRDLMHQEIKERSAMTRDHDIVLDRAEDHGDYLQLKKQSQNNQTKDEKSKDAMEYKDWKHGEREYISGIDQEVQDKAFEHIKQQQEQRKQQQTKEQERSHGRER